MPPANDNFANAENLLGASGYASGNNLGATVQSGEPGGGLKTVWFQWFWTPSDFADPIESTDQSKAFFFHTLETTQQEVDGLPPLQTFMRIYRGNSIGSLTEVAYTAFPWPSRYAGAGFGSFLAFRATPDTLYHIKIGGLTETEGHYLLKWGPFFLPVLGACGDIDVIRLGLGWECVGISAPPVNVNGSYVIGDNLPVGTYVGGYCGFGAWNDGPDPQRFFTYAHQQGQIPGSPVHPNYWSEFVFKEEGVDAPMQISTNSPPETHRTNRRAEDWGRCSTTSEMYHSGGNILIRFFDNNLPDNAAGPNGNPVFRLWRVIAVWRVAVFGFWEVAPNTVRISLTLTNLSIWSFFFITASLQTGGSITNPSGPQFFDAFANGSAHDHATLNWTCNPTLSSNTILTATVVFDKDSPPLTFTITPILSIVPGQPFVKTAATCAGQPFYNVNIFIQNTGNISTKAMFARVTLPAGVSHISNTCGLTGGVRDVSPNVQIPINSNGFIELRIRATGTSAAIIISVQPIDGPVTHPTLLVNVGALQ